ncbi:DUF3185 family protein [Paucihalobacter ruber]|uniref:DUF3185 family protein n=1 Tax=Paucihalobacter ruber TaxID=2567861 RepID=A0A506PQD4_9FLAO|nr:DUF3185 family protein [Paucihalobacter ruber]TPV35799.1 DUF3185 family protein [Paucihalobacter ruber]
MKITKIVGILLIVAGVFLGYLGITKIVDNSAEVKIFDLEIDVSNESGKEQGYVYLGIAALLFAGGVYSLKKK